MDRRCASDFHFLRLIWGGLLGGMLTLVACDSANAPDCLKSTGTIQTSERVLTSTPTALQLEDNVNCEFRTGPVAVSVSAGKNLLPEIISEVSGDELRIANRNRCNWVRKYGIPVRSQVQLPALKNLTLQGFGTCTLADTVRAFQLYLKCYGASTLTGPVITDQVHVDLNGEGTARLTGRTNYLYVATLKTGKADLRHLRARTIDVDMFGENELHVYASEVVRGRMNSYATLYIHGRPDSVLVQRSGPGKVVVLD